MDITISVDIVPSIKKSSWELKIMVWVVFQLTVVNVTLLTDVVSSSVGEDTRVKTTGAVGCASSTIVKLAVCVDASVSPPARADRVNPGISLSALSTVTVWDPRPVKAGSDPVLMLAVIETVCVPSTKTSSTDVRVTTCGIFQLVGVNVTLPTLRLTSVVSKLWISMIISVNGAAVSTRLTCAVCGFPSVKVPDTVLRAYPATSSSRMLIT